MKTPAELAARLRKMVLAAQHHYSPQGEPMRSIVVSPEWLEDMADAANALDAATAAPVAQPDDEFEVRADGKRVRVDRWEVAIRRIVALLWGNRHEFEVDDVVEAVRALVPAPNEDDEALVQTVLSGNYSGTPNSSVIPAVPQPWLTQSVGISKV